MKLSTRTSREEFAERPPQIIQGGMGVGVSGWRLARRVGELGQFGVVSGTALDTVVVRELQNGDPNGRLESLAEYPDQEIVAYLKDTFFVEGGIGEDKPYKLLPIYRFNPTLLSQRILCAAAYSEVYLAKKGHKGLVGMNLLCKLKRYTLPCMYGATLAGVDAILMGAGIPMEEAVQLPILASGRKARLRVDVIMARATDKKIVHYIELDPADLVPNPVPMESPMFFPIIAVDTLARILDKKLAPGLVSGYIIEGPVAGGHNAPPRGKVYDETGNPIYDERDIANVEQVAALGIPFYLAGGYGTPQRLVEAQSQGAAGIQVGSLFSLSDESGYPTDQKRDLIGQIHAGKASIRADGRTSSTGFPFKVLEIEGTLGQAVEYERRKRICDLGYLQEPYLDENNKLQVRCPAEPVKTYTKKGNDIADTERRACLCNALTANIGLGQRRKGEVEKELYTAGDDLLNLPLGSEENPHFGADEVIGYLL